MLFTKFTTSLVHLFKSAIFFWLFDFLYLHSGWVFMLCCKECLAGLGAEFSSQGHILKREGALEESSSSLFSLGKHSFDSKLVWKKSEMTQPVFGILFRPGQK